MPYSSLGKGFVTGKIYESTTLDKTCFRITVPHLSPENRKANQVFIELIATIAQRQNASPVQIALAWLLEQKPICTHEDSGIGSSERDIKKLCPHAIVLPAIAMRGGSIVGADNLVDAWLKRLEKVNQK